MPSEVKRVVPAFKVVEVGLKCGLLVCSFRVHWPRRQQNRAPCIKRKSRYRKIKLGRLSSIVKGKRWPRTKAKHCPRQAVQIAKLCSAPRQTGIGMGHNKVRKGRRRWRICARSRDSRIPRHLFRGRCVAGHFMRTSRHNGRYCLKGADDLAGDGMTRALCTRQYKKSRRKRGWTATKRQCRKKCD
jgi:hypothetical protein